MFGMGFTEIILVVIVAIIFLGPEKLPQAMIDIAKFFRALKKTIGDAKDSLDREINISEIRQEALNYRKNLQEDANKLTQELKLDNLDPVLDDSAKGKLQPKQGSNTEDHAHAQEKLQSVSAIKSPAQGGELNFKNPAPKNSEPKESTNV